MEYLKEYKKIVEQAQKNEKTLEFLKKQFDRVSREQYGLAAKTQLLVDLSGKTPEELEKEFIDSEKNLTQESKKPEGEKSQE